MQPYACPWCCLLLSADHLLLLSKGKIVYQGLAQQAIDHFAKDGFPCPMHENPGKSQLPSCALHGRSHVCTAWEMSCVHCMQSSFAELMIALYFNRVCVCTADHLLDVITPKIGEDPDRSVARENQFYRSYSTKLAPVIELNEGK
jgi:hypothetical protein